MYTCSYGLNIKMWCVHIFGILTISLLLTVWMILISKKKILLMCFLLTFNWKPCFSQLQETGSSNYLIFISHL